jgi:hypothetical protein
MLLLKRKRGKRKEDREERLGRGREGRDEQVGAIVNNKHKWVIQS